MIATQAHIQTASETLPAPAICTPADFNQYLARAKARALAALVRIIDDPATPPDEIRKAATAITRTQFIPMPKPTATNANANLNPDAALWGACDDSATSSTTIEFKKFNATVEPDDDDETEAESESESEAEDEASNESEHESAAESEPTSETEIDANTKAKTTTAANTNPQTPPAPTPHNHPPLPPAAPITAIPSTDAQSGGRLIGQYAPGQRQI